MTFDLAAIRDWYFKPRTPQTDAGAAAALYFQFHPRTAFIKTLPFASVLADIGAGDGSLSVFRRWPDPVREDLQVHAYALHKGRLFDEFASFEIGDWNSAPPEFGGLCFDAIVCAHFIEHIHEPATLMHWAARKLKPGGRIYLEWPSANALTLPDCHELATVGVQLVTSRFDDDPTHRRVLPTRAEVLAAFAAAGLEVEQQGLIHLPWLEHELMAHSRDAEDGFPRQAAFWSWTRWCQHVVARKPG